MMKPESFTMKKQEFVVIHTCVVCGFVRRNRLSEKDDMKALIALRQKPL